MPVSFNESPLSLDFISAQHQDRFLPVPLWVLIMEVMVIAVIVGIVVTLREEEETAERPVEVPPRPDSDLIAPDKVPAVLEAQVTEVEPEPVAPPPRPDNLKRITGIGPKIETLLNENGITTFAQLAQTEVNRLQAILEEAGLENIADPGSWPEQARQLAQ